jgi:hypothetical protein
MGIQCGVLTYCAMTKSGWLAHFSLQIFDISNSEDIEISSSSFEMYNVILKTMVTLLYNKTSELFLML